MYVYRYVGIIRIESGFKEKVISCVAMLFVSFQEEGLRTFCCCGHYMRLLSLVKGAVISISSDFCPFFARAKWRLLAQVSRTSDHDSLVSRENSFAAQDESSNRRFPWSCLATAVILLKVAQRRKKREQRRTYDSGVGKKTLARNGLIN